MKIEKLQPGLVVWDVARRKMGNTSLRTVDLVRVTIIAIDPDRGIVTASYGFNPPRDYRRRTWSKWRLNKPTLISTGFSGQYRLAHRGEKTHEA